MESQDHREWVWHTTEELILQTKLHKVDRLQLRSYFCPYRNCHRGKRVAIGGIKQHLQKVGRDPFFMRSMLGGDPPEGYLEFGS
jgi:hypothetical protein